VGICLIAGKSIEFFLPILPASLYGMMIFTILLHYRFLNAKRIQPCIEWALANMAVCFVPAGVGIINHYELIKNHGFMLVTIIFFTTFLLLTFVGMAYQRQLNANQQISTKELGK
jgi:holin-like protein